MDRETIHSNKKLQSRTEGVGDGDQALIGSCEQLPILVSRA